jgi:hypothetical protein
MSKLSARLEQLLGQVQEMPGVDKQSIANMLRKIGEVQAMVDNYDSGSPDPNLMSEIQSQLGSFRLSGRVTNELLMGVRLLNDRVGSTAIQESSVKNLLDSLAKSQAGLADANQDPALTAANIAVLRQLFGQAETMMIQAMDALKLKDQTIMSLLQKLKLKG